MRSPAMFGLAGLVFACGRIQFDETDDARAARGCTATFTAYGDAICAVRTDGAVYCWQSNDVGQLGDGTTLGRLVPGPAMITDVVRIASGEDTVCAVRGDGSLWCWGEGSDGQIGDAASLDRAVPTQVTLRDRVVEIDVGQWHTCARLADGTGWCWGSNEFGELERPAGGISAMPVPSSIGGNLDVVVGDHVTCMVRPDRTLSCWGRNSVGELGDGTTTSRPDAAPVIAIPDPITSAAAGCHRHVCVATSAGDAWCWGENLRGQVGSSPSPFEATPRRVAGLANVVAVTVGAFHSCARTTTNEVWCWGANDTGQLGDGTFVDRASPVRASMLDAPIRELQAACGSTHALLDDRRLVAWGNGRALGTGDPTHQANAVEVPVPCE